MRRPAALPIAVLAALLVAGGVAGVRLARTRNHPPALCPGTPKLLASLHQTVTVDAYVTRGTPELDRFVGSLEALLQQYQLAGGGHFQFHVVEAKDDETKKRAKEAGLGEMPFAAAGDAGAAMVQGFMGLVFHYGTAQDVIRQLPPDHAEGLEFWIDNKLRELRAKAEKQPLRVGVLAGHGEIPLGEANLVPATMGKPTLQQIITQNFPFYAFRDVNLRGSAPIDADLAGLLVTQPSSDLAQEDLARIDDFVMRGKPVAFFVGAANVQPGDPSMRATLSTHGLERLLAGYGVELGRDLVVDPGPKAAVSFGVQTSTGPVHPTAPFVLLLRDEDRRLDASFPVFFRMTEVAFPYASSLVVHREKQPEASVREIARTTPQAVRVGGSEVDVHPMKAWAPEGPVGAVVVAAAVDGVLHGAFDPARKSAGRARVLVVASSEFLANPFARAVNVPPSAPGAAPPPGDETLALVAGPYAQAELTSTILAFKNTLDWLAFEDDLVDCSLLADAGK